MIILLKIAPIPPPPPKMIWYNLRHRDGVTAVNPLQQDVFSVSTVLGQKVHSSFPDLGNICIDASIRAKYIFVLCRWITWAWQTWAKLWILKLVRCTNRYHQICSDNEKRMTDLQIDRDRGQGDKPDV